MIGNKITYHRRAQNLTQEELVEGICSTSYLSKVENNVLEPSEEILHLLFKRLKLESEQESKQYALALADEIYQWYEYMKEGDMTEAEELFEPLKRKAEKVSSPEVKLTFSVFEFRYWLIQYDYTKSEELHTKLIRHMDQLSPELLYYFYTFKINYSYIQHTYIQALEYAGKAMDLVQTHKIDIQPETYYFQALVHLKLNNTILGKYDAERALDLFTKQGNIKKCVSSHITLGICYNRMKKPEDAKKFYLNALKLSQKLDLINDCAYINHNLGYMESQSGNHTTAIAYFHKSIEIKQTHHIKRIKNSIHHLAVELQKTNQTEAALKWIEKGLSEENDSEKNYDMKLTFLKLQIKNEETALINFIMNSAIPYFQAHRMWMDESECYEILAKQFADKHHYKKSSFYFSEANRLRKENHM